MADNSTIITWNATNWITVILMAAVGFAALGLATKLYRQRTGAA